MTRPHRERRRGSWLWALVGVALVLTGAGAVVVADSFNDPAALRLVGPDTPVNVGARSASDISAHNSPTLVRNPVRPDNLAVSSRIDTPFFSCALHYSLDGGASWKQTAIPSPKGEEPKCFAPDLAFSADGTLYLSFVTLEGRGNTPSAVWLSTSKDGGRTLSKPGKVLGRPLAFQVRLAADPVKPKRLYMTWLQGKDVAPLRFTGTGNPINAIRSDDGGKSWQKPVRVSKPSRERVVTPAPVVGPKGELYVLYLDLGKDKLDYAAGHEGRGGPPYRGRFTLVLARSLDGGSKWDESVVAGDVVPTQRFIVFFPPSPSVAVDQEGRIYAAFQDGRLGDPDVLLWSLEPGGSSWEGPTRVNDNEERDGTSQYLPKISVAPNGRLDILYYDRRADRIVPAPAPPKRGQARAPKRPRNIMNDVSLQSSLDDGETFSKTLRLTSRSFDSRIGFGRKERLPDLGSRLAMISDDRFALGLWTDTRAGSAVTQKQDLAEALVAATNPPQLFKPVGYLLRYGGLGLGLAGLALLGLWFTGRVGRSSGRN